MLTSTKNEPRQLPLDIALAPKATLENFVIGSNGEALACLMAMRATADPQLVYLWGEEGVGKTHLAQAMGLKGTTVPVFTPGRMRYAVDDVDALSEAGLNALFVLINEIRVHPGTTLVMTGSKPPAENTFREDVRTRLGWGPVFHIQPLSDDVWVALLAQAKARDIVVTPEAQKWMQLHLPRDMKSLARLIDQMDSQLFALKKNAITVPILKAWLDEVQATQFRSHEAGNL